MSSVIISFVISLYLIFQMCKDFISKTLHVQLNEALAFVWSTVDSSAVCPAGKNASADRL